MSAECKPKCKNARDPVSAASQTVYFVQAQLCVWVILEIKKAQYLHIPEDYLQNGTKLTARQTWRPWSTAKQTLHLWDQILPLHEARPR